MRVISIMGRRRYICLAALIIVPAVMLLAALMPQYLTAPVGSGFHRVPVYEVATEQQAVAISFDASWGAEYTPLILDILDDFGIKTTFFLVNIWIEDYPELTREIAMRGHEIGLHSVTHPHFPELSDEQIIHELTANAELIYAVSGYTPRLFRPPFGDYDDRVLELAEELGFISIQWSVDSLDWMDLSAEEIISRVMQDIHAGDIVLFHNNGLHTAEALPEILRRLQEMGLAVVPISELLLGGDCYTDINGIQRGR